MSAEEDRAIESDWELLQRTVSGEREAYAEFVRRHQVSVFRHLCILLARREDAEDLLQETFLAAFRGAGQFRGDGPARAWLFQIARHAAYRRTAEVQGEVSLEDLAVEAGWGMTGENPESLAMLAEDRQRLDGALAALPAEERELLLLREWEGLSGEETAQLLGLSLAAMKSRLHRARLRLGALLRRRQRGGVSSDGQ